MRETRAAFPTNSAGFSATQRERPAKRRSMRCSASCPKRICSTVPTSGPRDNVRLLSRLTMLRVEPNLKLQEMMRTPGCILRRQGANIGWI